MGLWLHCTRVDVGAVLMAKKPPPAPEPVVIEKPAPPAPGRLAEAARVESLTAEMDRLYTLRREITASPAQTALLLLQAEQALRDEYERLTGAPPAPRA